VFSRAIVHDHDAEVIRVGHVAFELAEKHSQRGALVENGSNDPSRTHALGARRKGLIRFAENRLRETGDVTSSNIAAANR